MSQRKYPNSQLRCSSWDLPQDRLFGCAHYRVMAFGLFTNTYAGSPIGVLWTTMDLRWHVHVLHCFHFPLRLYAKHIRPSSWPVSVWDFHQRRIV